MSDAELLNEYLATGSEPAFAELVQRYINLVYSAARRQVRDTDMAEDVTQAVFIILADKAAAIRNPAMLGAWLVKTTWQTSCNAIRFERCRRLHEQRAAAMNTAYENADGEGPAARIEGVLDKFLSRLGEKERGALVFRYLEDKSVADVALALNISQPAAQKRIGRGLAHLKNMLTRRGIVTAGAALEQGLSSQVLHSAPPDLARLVSSGATGKIGAGGGHLLAHATAKNLFSAKVKAIVLGLAASGAAVAMVAVVAVNSLPNTRASAAGAAINSPPAPTSAPATVPALADTAGEFPVVHLANDAFKRAGAADEYLNDIDLTTLRTPESSPAGHIKSLIPNIPTDGFYSDLRKILARRIFVGPLNGFRGKRIRISGRMKTNNVRECAGMDMYAYNDGGELVATDETTGMRPIHGTTDWQKYEMVQDIPPDATKITLGAELYCSGEIWMDDFQVEVVGSDVPVTEDQDWQIVSPVSQRYIAAIDLAVQRNGHATTCVTSMTAPHFGWAIYGHYEMHPDPQFLGHRIRASGWIKSGSVTGNSGFKIDTFGAWDKPLTNEGQRFHRPIIGTRDWRQYSAVANVPPETKSIFWGLTMNGRGKLWIDMESVEVDLADDTPNPADGPGN